ncbi:MULTISPECIES: aminodeoxychorismate lyase [unclassified Cryobacterium]|uniref:aminodeoxychorismate lyase n=1 Tax=unclassified Cryobacterium TaxID=2649013 RepID=UPI001069010F|nr:MULTISPECIES: aminodeoxychorismate lyase [unclassified Cryobacterium]MEB0002963.1 aminodeoxychorismate lyase [Cryobacterium sp. RTC2.1]TFB98531.1 aminodeoxychorismate lyase [Cryobacterium sp. MDB2-A-1]TFC08414.1 aminodeoxychorismate lyase [Cryobacterium sp. MDB2-33-2]TFC08680.1 aminodeoxychorismate lyase [Cryobacterium sp. MDB2-A-2]TFC22264.1 aminodeoxychorismate lyase [Cryobacterium sp. MDB2-10]
MTLPFTLLIDPVPADSAQADFAGTFHEMDSAAPALRVGELSTQRGDGIFETLSVVDGHPQEVEAHITRLRHSAEICDLPVPNPAQWREAIAYAVARVPHEGELALKFVLSRGVQSGPAPTAWLHATRAPDHSAARENGVRVITLDRGYPRGVAEVAPWLLMGAKTLSYAINMAALREARRRGADDTIFLTHDGYVMEGPTSSVVIRSNGVYVTPAPSGAILHGTTQQSLFEHLREQGEPVEYRDITVAELRAADAVWLLSSIRLVVAVTELDGLPLATDLPRTRVFNAYLLGRTD